MRLDKEYYCNISSNKGSDKFESNIDRFLEIPKQVNVSKHFPDDKSITEEEVEWIKSRELMEESNKYRSTNRYIIPEDEYKSPRMIQISYIKDDSVQKFNQIESLDPSTETFDLPNIFKNDLKSRRISLPRFDRQFSSNQYPKHRNKLVANLKDIKSIPSINQEDEEYKEAKIEEQQNSAGVKNDDLSPIFNASDIEIMKNPKPKVSKKLLKKDTINAIEEELEFRRKKHKVSRQLSTNQNLIKSKLRNLTNRGENNTYKPIDRIKRIEKAKQQKKEMMLSKDMVIDFDDQTDYQQTPNRIESLDFQNIDDVFKMDSSITPKQEKIDNRQEDCEF